MAFVSAARGPGVYEGPLDLGTQEDLENISFHSQLYGRRIYNYDAVSGAQIQIKLGEKILLDDVTAIQFSLSQSKKPIYGYHSTYFDTVAPGVVIVHGRLFINFVHQGYLRLLMNAAVDPQFLDKIKNDATRAVEDAKKGYQTYDGKPKSIDDAFRFVRDKAAQRQREEIVHSQGLSERPDLFAALTKIQIKYGNEQEFENVPEKIIHNVHFIGEGQEIQISGQPIQEMFEFVARRVT